MRNTVRCVVLAVVFVVGALLGRLTCGTNDRRPAPPVDHTQPITIRRADEKVLYLVPYAVAIDGRSERLREMDESTRWIIWHNGARVQVSYTEQSDPR